MVSALVLSLWRNMGRLHLMDVVLNYNFIGCTSESALLKFMEKHAVDVIDIKTPSHLYSIDV